MLKRFFCLVLTVCLLTTLAPNIAAAPPASTAVATPEPVTVPIWQGEYQTLSAYRYGSDLLFSASDLARLSGFEMTSTADCIEYHRGLKVVTVHLTNHTITARRQDKTTSLNSPVQLIESEYFLSASSMLSWLNMRCSVEDGTLILVPTLVSIWDILDDNFVISRDDFSMATCAELMLRSEKELTALAYVEKSFSGKFVDYISHGGWTTEQYYNLFNDLVLDQSASQETNDLLLKQAEEISYTLDNAQLLLSFVFPEKKYGDAANVIEPSLSAAKKLSRYYVFCKLYTQDHSLKMAMLDSLLDNQNYAFDDALITAAGQAKLTYSNFWAGTLFTVGYDTIYAWAEDLTSFDILNNLGLRYIFGIPQNVLMERFRYYETLSDTACDLFLDMQYHSSYRDAISIFDMEAYAMLFYYGVEQRYRAMAQHCLDNDYIDDFIADFLNEYADAAQAKYSLFEAAAASADCDSLNIYERTRAANNILKLFEDVAVTVPTSGICAAAQRGILLATAREYHPRAKDWHWKMVDFDSDGTEELVTYGRLYPGEPVNFMILDGDSFGTFTLSENTPLQQNHTTDAFTHSKNVTLQQDRTTGTYYIVCETREGLETLTEYYTWSNHGWSVYASAYVCPIYEYEGPEILMEEQYTLQGRTATKEDYAHAVAELDLMEANALTMDMDSPDLLDVHCQGTPEMLMNQLQDYVIKHFENQQIGWRDLNGDGAQDLLIAIYNADRTLIASAQSPRTADTDFFLKDISRSLTLIAAIDTGDGVRLRTMNTWLPLNHIKEKNKFMRFLDGYLKIEQQLYTYQEMGAPFTISLEQDPIGADLLGTPWTDVDGAIDFNQGLGNIDWGFGYYGKFHVTVHRGPLYIGDELDTYGVDSVQFTQFYRNAYELMPDLYPGLTCSEFLLFPPEGCSNITTPKTVTSILTGETMTRSSCYWYDETTEKYYLAWFYFRDDDSAESLLFVDMAMLEYPPNID